MDYIESFIGLIGLIIALWALNLQRREIIKNGKINALIHSASLIQEKIDYHSKIIDDKKAEGKNYEDWEGHANRINKELRPLKEKIDIEFLNVVSGYDGLLHEGQVRRALKPKSSKTTP